MSKNFSTILSDYIPAFEDVQEPFLFHYSFGRNQAISQRELTRGEFWSLAQKAAGVIRDSGLKRGDCFAHCFGANQYCDPIFRLAATMTGTIPVTINWQADTIDRVVYKIELTESKLVLLDGLFDPEHLTSIKTKFPQISTFQVEGLGQCGELPAREFQDAIEPEFTRITIFTSGTTGQPKGVDLSYRAYRNNRATFEQFLEIKPTDKFAVFIVNPMHHGNSTAITDWAARRPGTRIHLLERYSGAYWKLLEQAASRNYDRLLAPAVSRHFDFLEALDRENRLPLEVERLKSVMSKVDFLIGSAPVGPTTIKRLQHYAGRIPNVRFGSTETCLQAIGTPRHPTEMDKLRAFENGWRHQLDGENQAGYYIGRPHPPFTEVRIVESIAPGDEGFMKDCEIGRPGYLVARGENNMTGYVKNPAETRKVFHHDWYLGLKDICFSLVNETDGELDYYWISRDSMMLIRGGANYAYDQVNAELSQFVSRHYQLPEDSFDIAVVGLKVDLEHEDSCCMTIETLNEEAETKLAGIGDEFKNLAARQVTKGSKPNYIRLAKIPRNFKGAVLVKELAAEYQEWLGMK